ncbi:SRPBCC family protein [Micromonosporaceae bacterium Da 78-11]
MTPAWADLHREIGVEGPRSADDVWDRYLRPRRWPEWSPQIRAVDYPRETLAAGTAGVVHGPAGLPVQFQVLDVDGSGPVRAWTWAASAAGVRLVLRHTVEATADGTRTGLTVDGFAPAVLAYLPAARWALHRLVH